MNVEEFQQLETYDTNFLAGMIVHSQGFNSEMRLHDANTRFNVIRNTYTSIRDSLLRMLDFLEYGELTSHAGAIRLANSIRRKLDRCRNLFLTVCEIIEISTIGIYDDEITVGFMEIIPHLGRINQNVEHANTIVDNLNDDYSHYFNAWIAHNRHD